MSQKKLKKSGSSLNSHNALIQHLSEKCNFRVSGFPGSAEAQIIWGGIVKRRLIAYFIGSMSAKKYQNPFSHCVKVIGSQRWDVFNQSMNINFFSCRHMSRCIIHRESNHVSVNAKLWQLKRLWRNRHSLEDRAEHFNVLYKLWNTYGTVEWQVWTSG